MTWGWALAVAFGSIFVVELPDKTFVATLVMSTRFRPVLVWLGVTSAFLVQTAVAVALGGVIARLPRPPVEVFAGGMFLLGGILLLRGATHAVDEERQAEERFTAKADRNVRGWHVVTLSFGVIFLAEWGDLSQILTASLVARSNAPVPVFIGAWLALATVSALGAILGRTLLRHIRLATIHRIGGFVCLVLAVVTFAEAAGVIGG